LVPPSPKSVLRFASFVGEKATLAAHPDLVDLMVATGRDPIAAASASAEMVGVFVVWPRSAHWPWGGGPQSGSRWSARSAARTNDLEADEDPPHTVVGRTEAKPLWFKSSAASHATAHVLVARAGAQPYLGPRILVRRHDD